LVMFFGGARYIYFYRLDSERQLLSKRGRYEVYAHLISAPVKPPRAGVQSWQGDLLERAPLGGRVGAELEPLFCLRACLNAGLAVGYSPVPAQAMVDFHLSF